MRNRVSDAKHLIAPFGRLQFGFVSGQLEKKEHALENSWYSWQWGPECECQDNPGLSGERQRQGDWQKADVIHPVTPHSHSSLVTGGHATPGAR